MACWCMVPQGPWGRCLRPALPHPPLREQYGVLQPLPGLPLPLEPANPAEVAAAG